VREEQHAKAASRDNQARLVGIVNSAVDAIAAQHLMAPRYVKMDMRFSKRSFITERVQVQGIIEFFNLFNRANPAAVQQFQNLSTPMENRFKACPDGKDGWGCGSSSRSAAVNAPADFRVPKRAS
jgi:hypothetical protein